jgi:hypothetical protein
MPKECSICTHVKREEINKVMDGGSSNRDVSRTYGISKSAVDRHRRNCLPAIRARSREIRAIERNLPVVSSGDPFVERLEDHATKMEMIRDAAMRNNDDKTAIAAGREVRGAYEVWGKAENKFQPMFGSRDQQPPPMFIMQSGAHIAVTVNHPITTSAMCKDDQPEIRNITPTETDKGTDG